MPSRLVASRQVLPGVGGVRELLRARWEAFWGQKLNTIRSEANHTENKVPLGQIYWAGRDVHGIMPLLAYRGRFGHGSERDKLLPQCGLAPGRGGGGVSVWRRGKREK